jgi:hypothetical protein
MAIAPFEKIIKLTSMATESNTDLLHLLGADIVHSDEEAFRVLIEQLLQYRKQRISDKIRHASKL